MGKPGARGRQGLTILFTCIGRRVSLLEGFRTAARRLRQPCRFVGADMTDLSAALQRCDARHVVPRVNAPNYLDALLDIVKRERVHLVVPTVDLDLKLLADHRDRFAAAGCRVLVSSPEVVAICQDKRKTFRFLSRHGIPVPETLSPATALRRPRLGYPRFLKPWDGHAGRGLAVAHNRQELAFYARRIPNAIVQDFLRGTEFTCDAYVDFDLQVRCVVPRQRIEVRAGEVSKGRVVKDRLLMDQAAALVQTLGAGPGVITIQLIKTGPDELRFIEINPRFGGGAPLSIKAGADFPRWVLQEMLGQKPRIVFDGFRDGLTMLRYDAEVWMD